MAGPGGGGRRGGGGRSRSGGGSRSFGSLGSYRSDYGDEYYHGWRWARPIIKLVCVAIVLLIYGVMLLADAVSYGYEVLREGGRVFYSEEKLQAYASAQYDEAFADSDAYEDNILIVVLVEEECEDFYYIAWVGDHVRDGIDNMLGNNYTELGILMRGNINDNYRDTLDSGLATVMDKLTVLVEDLGLMENLQCNEPRLQSESYVKNNSNLQMYGQLVDKSLKDFSDSTGIPAVIVVEDMGDVFGKVLPPASYVIIVLFIAILAGGTFLIIRLIKKKKPASVKEREDRMRGIAPEQFE